MLVNCLIGSESRELGTHECSQFMGRFETELVRPVGAQKTSELARALAVTEGTLRKCCVAFLGMGPGQYARLRRLNWVRAALRQPDPRGTGLASS